MNGLKRGVRAVFARLENLLDRLCTPAFNPLGQLGALGWFLFWLIAISGIYLYIFFDTGVTQAYTSIESITQDQWWAGGIMRSFHRYASDGLVVVAFLHMLREFGLDRLRGRRWFAWITGLLLIGFIYVCGITGYWMVWDQLAQYVALTTSAWLDALPIFAEPISRNFLNNASLSGRFFTLMVYVHIAAPLLMLLFMWIHIQRYNYARVNPPRRMMVVAVAAFVALSLLDPALSQAPANLDALAVSVRLDWFYVALYPLTETVGAPALWWGVILAFVILTALPGCRHSASRPLPRSTSTTATAAAAASPTARLARSPCSRAAMVPRSRRRPSSRPTSVYGVAYALAPAPQPPRFDAPRR